MGQSKVVEQTEKESKTVEIKKPYTTSKLLRAHAENFLVQQFQYPSAWVSDVGEEYAQFLTLAAMDIVTRRLVVLDHERGTGIFAPINVLMEDVLEEEEDL